MHVNPECPGSSRGKMAASAPFLQSIGFMLSENDIPGPGKIVFGSRMSLRYAIEKVASII